MIVAGGTYREICEFPRDEQLFGSGLRGAAAITEVSNDNVELHTFLGEDAITEARRRAAAFGFNLNRTDIQETITFHYIHNHSNPEKRSNLPRRDREIGPISGDSILRYGFVEGNAVVNGQHVVYDPQSPEAEHFHENGSEAAELALVLNRQEAESFSGEETVDRMLEELTTGENSADVVVIKCGPSGALVRAENTTSAIPVYETESVWNIGSGDVFSAMFAVYWAEKNLPPVEAAAQASLGTAYFCKTRELPIPENLGEVEGFEPVQREPTIDKEGPKIYLAAPFFNPGEFWLMEEIDMILSEEGADVFAPYFDVGPALDHENPNAVAQKDLEALENVDVVLALLDTNDSGTLFEIGYARSLDIPVIIYQTEPRRSQTTMLEGSGCEVYSDLSTTIFKALWAAR